ncbi:MAG: ABC transporter substrate-binding protein [Clostridium sp.]|uniref:ABC transporter substrate-binding protein n=1 Tax=Clostridium sp. TaxID=1506 RepID=UPI003EE79417
MNITIIKSNPLSISFILGKKIGLLKDVNLNIIDDFKFIGENPYINGESDLMIGDITFFFYALEKGIDSVITSNLTRTIHLVLGKGKNIKESGLKIGVNRTGMFRLFLEYGLKEHIPKNEIVWINNTFERIEKLKNGEIDGMIAINPFVDKIEHENIGNISWSLRNTGENLVMYCFRRDYYERNTEKIKKFHKDIRKAGQIFNNMSLDEKKIFLKEDMKYEKEYELNFINFKFEEEKDFKKEDFEICMKWMFKNDEIKKEYKYKDYIKSLGI